MGQRPTRRVSDDPGAAQEKSRETKPFSYSFCVDKSYSAPGKVVLPHSQETATSGSVFPSPDELNEERQPGPCPDRSVERKANKASRPISGAFRSPPNPFGCTTNVEHNSPILFFIHYSLFIIHSFCPFGNTLLLTESSKKRAVTERLLFVIPLAVGCFSFFSSAFRSPCGRGRGSFRGRLSRQDRCRRRESSAGSTELSPKDRAASRS